MIIQAISIRQPWAELVLLSKKDVEVRSWSTRYRGPLLIHAGGNLAPLGPDERQDMIDRINACRGPRSQIDSLRDLPRGGIVGQVQLVEIVEDHPSEWASDELLNWVLERPRRLPFKPLLGKLRLFPVSLPGSRKALRKR